MRFMNSNLFTEKKRTISLIIISVLMNSILFLIAHYLNLPLWLDTTGTIYISCIIGFPAGFLVAIILNITESIWIYGKNSLLFYFVSLLTALTAGKVYSKYKNTKLKKWIIMLLLTVVGCGSAIIITFIVSGGVPSNYWSAYLYQQLTAAGINKIISSCLAVSAVKCLDIAASVLIVALAIKITPVKLKTKKVVLMERVDV